MDTEGNEPVKSMNAGQLPGKARLLSPDAAATYLGLGSRWAIYRLVKTGGLPAVIIANKLRIDRADLERLIETKKSLHPAASAAHTASARPRARLAPLAWRGTRTVTLR